MSDRAISFHRPSSFGQFLDQILDVERDNLAGCPFEVFKLILVLRRLLKGTKYEVMHKTNWEYDPYDSCMSETEIMIYRPTQTEWLQQPAVFELLARVVLDQASSAGLPDTPDYSYRWSSGSFESVSTRTPYGIVCFDPWETVQLLLRNAAAAGGYSISFRQIRRDEFRIRVWNAWEEPVVLGTAYLTSGHYQGRVNCVIELA